MKKALFFLCLIVQCAQAQTLYPSEHDTPSGQAELNSFLIFCENDCFFTMFLKIHRLDFESSSESGAMYRIWNESRDQFILFGIDANKKTQEAQITLTSSKDNEKHILSSSKIGAFEGFRFEWKDEVFELKNLRDVPKEGYTRIEESGIAFKGALNFKPHSIEYLFLGVQVTQYVDTTSQNINPEWKNTGSGS